MAGQQVRVMVDLMSQPCRAVQIFCRASGLRHEMVTTRIAKGEHKTEDMTRWNPLQKLPLILDGDVAIRDSKSAVRYLTRKYQLDDHWYPKDLVAQARVEEYLHWEHLNTRFHASIYVWKLFFTPMMKTGMPSQDEKLREELTKNVESCMDKVEKVFLKDGENKYIAGGDKISVADVFACCEMEQPFSCGYDVAKDRPVLSQYMSRVRQELNPHYDEAHYAVFKVAKKNFGMERS